MHIWILLLGSTTPLTISNVVSSSSNCIYFIFMNLFVSEKNSSLGIFELSPTSVFAFRRTFCRRLGKIGAIHPFQYCFVFLYLRCSLASLAGFQLSSYKPITSYIYCKFNQCRKYFNQCRKSVVTSARCRDKVRVIVKVLGVKSCLRSRDKFEISQERKVSHSFISN